MKIGEVLKNINFSYEQQDILISHLKETHKKQDPSDLVEFLNENVHGKVEQKVFDMLVVTLVENSLNDNWDISKKSDKVEDIDNVKEVNDDPDDIKNDSKKEVGDEPTEDDLKESEEEKDEDEEKIEKEESEEDEEKIEKEESEEDEEKIEKEESEEDEEKIEKEECSGKMKKVDEEDEEKVVDEDEDEEEEKKVVDEDEDEEDENGEPRMKKESEDEEEEKDDEEKVVDEESEDEEEKEKDELDEAFDKYASERNLRFDFSRAFRIGKADRLAGLEKDVRSSDIEIWKAGYEAGWKGADNDVNAPINKNAAKGCEIKDVPNYDNVKEVGKQLDNIKKGNVGKSLEKESVKSKKKTRKEAVEDIDSTQQSIFDTELEDKTGEYIVDPVAYDVMDWENQDIEECVKRGEKIGASGDKLETLSESISKEKREAIFNGFKQGQKVRKENIDKIYTALLFAEGSSNKFDTLLEKVVVGVEEFSTMLEFINEKNCFFTDEEYELIVDHCVNEYNKTHSEKIEKEVRIDDVIVTEDVKKSNLIFDTITEGLTVIDKAKIESLVEGMEFETPELYEEHIKILVEEINKINKEEMEKREEGIDKSLLNYMDKMAKYNLYK